MHDKDYIKLYNEFNQETGRIVGLMLLVVFAIGVFVYQYLRGPIVFGDDYLTNTSLKSSQIIASTLLAFLSGTISIVVAVILLPLFKKYSSGLAYLYLAFCIINFVAISAENYGVLALMEVSNAFVVNGVEGVDFFQNLGAVYYENHRWAHYMYLLVSCFPVFVLYYTLFYSRLMPRIISIFGIIAVLLMLVDVLISIFGESSSMNLLIPMGLVQLFLPFWLLLKGFKQNSLDQI